MRLTVQAITGPGAVEIDLDGLEGPERVLSSQDPARTTVVEQVGAHTHTNWVFPAPGTYVLTMVAEATGLLVLTAVFLLAFLLGPRRGVRVRRARRERLTADADPTRLGDEPGRPPTWSILPVRDGGRS